MSKQFIWFEALRLEFEFNQYFFWETPSSYFVNGWIETAGWPSGSAWREARFYWFLYARQTLVGKLQSILTSLQNPDASRRSRRKRHWPEVGFAEKFKIDRIKLSIYEQALNRCGFIRRLLNIAQSPADRNISRKLNFQQKFPAANIKRAAKSLYFYSAALFPLVTMLF